jgi:hypothetical protein
MGLSSAPMRYISRLSVTVARIAREI